MLFRSLKSEPIRISIEQYNKEKDLDNLHHFGNEDVLKSSEIVDMAVKKLIMDAAEKKKLDKDLKKQNKKKKGDNE